MLIRPGRGIMPPAHKTAAHVFSFLNALPSGFSHSRNDTVSTYRDSTGTLRIAAANAPRFDHTRTGAARGLLIEGQIQNKHTHYNAVPTATTGFIATGTATLALVADATALTAAGLAAIVTGNVFEVSGGASGGTLTLSATTGSTSNHSFSTWARLTAGSSATLTHTGTSPGTATIAGAAYTRIALENQTISASTVKQHIIVPAGVTVRFILCQMELNPFCTSVIVTSGSAATRQRDICTYANVNTAPWFDYTKGYLAARYRVMGFIGGSGNQYMAAFSDNSSNNLYGLRLINTDNDIGLNMRVGGTSFSPASNDVPRYAGQLCASAMAWSAGEIYQYDGDNPKTATPSSLPSGLDRLNIGGRNGGNDPLFGWIESVEIGKTYKTAAALGARAHKNSDLVVVGAGQSLIAGHWNSQVGSSKAGRNTMISLAAANITENTLQFIDGSTGGSAAAWTSDNVKYWWRLDTQTRGPCLETFYQQAVLAGHRIDVVLWAQGEADADRINVDTSRAQYKQCLEAIFADMRAAYGDIPILIQRIGTRTGAWSDTDGTQIVREVQQEIIDENPWCHAAGEIYDVALAADGVHLSDAGYVSVAGRDARKLLSVLGCALPGVDGPRITGAVRSGTGVTVTLAHDAGTDFTPSSGISGFKFFDGASAIAINAAVRSNATTITLTLASTPTGVETLYYIYDADLTLDKTNVVRDNATPVMPLRSTRIVL